MRTFAFILALIAISSVTSLQSSLSSRISEDANIKIQYEKLSETNIGSIIFNLAELQTEGRFAVLFDAIDNLKTFLAKALVQENSDFARITTQWQADVARLTKAAAVAKELYETDNANLNGKYYPHRKQLQATIRTLQHQLAGLKKNKADLEAARLHEIAVFKAAKADYSEGISSLKEAMPLLNSLLNDASFLEVNAEQFVATYADMKQKLGKLQYGLLYTNFVQSLEMMLTDKHHFTNQKALKEVIDALKSLQARLEKGQASLYTEEAHNLKQYNEQHARLVKAIASTEKSLATNEANLKALQALIKATEKHRDQQVALYKAAVKELKAVQQAYANRKAQHIKLVAEIGKEEQIIAEAVHVLNKANITRNA